MQGVNGWAGGRTRKLLLRHLVCNGVDGGVVSTQPGGADELSHLLLILDGINSRLERHHAGDDDAGAQQQRCRRPLHAARLCDGAAGKQRRALGFYKNHGSACVAAGGDVVF